MAEPVRYDGHAVDVLARLFDLPRVVARGRLSSTLDLAHELAREGAPSGTLVLSDEQTAGRGRSGAPWQSAPGAGIWMTLLERPNDPAALEVLSLRIGLRAAAVLDRFAGEPVRLKWPNDLHLAGGKLGGILVETRWRDGRPDWTAIGIGINIRPPAGMRAAGLHTGSSRIEVLAELVPAVRAAATARGALTGHELEAFAARDLAAGRACRAPAVGRVRGITAAGELRIARGDREEIFRGGSLVLEETA